MVSKAQLKRELAKLLKTEEEWDLLEEITPITLDPYQKKVWKRSYEGFDPDPTKSIDIRYSNKTREVDLCCHRGYGKTFLEGCHRMIKMIKYPGWQSYTVYPKREQAIYSLAYTKSLIQGSPYTDWMVKKAFNWGETKITLHNQAFSFVISPSQRTATGYHVNQGYVGEAARWADDWDAIYESAIMPMSNRKKGQIWKTSSAFGERGFFYKSLKGSLKNRNKWIDNETGLIYDDGVSQKWLLDVNATTIFNEEDKKYLKEKHGTLMYSQEYLCNFIGSSETYIPLYLINKQMRNVNHFSFYDLVDGNATVDMLGIDPGVSVDDLGVAGVRKIRPGKYEVCIFEELQLDHYNTLTDMLIKVKNRNPKMKIFQESTGNQIMLKMWLESRGVRVEGVDFGSAKKQDYYDRFTSYLRNDRIYLPKENELCRSQLNYIPFKMRGTHIHFPDDSLGHHALHALFTINLGVGNSSFNIRSTNY